jgi:hypothetical protein
MNGTKTLKQQSNLILLASSEETPKSGVGSVSKRGGPGRKPERLVVVFVPESHSSRATSDVAPFESNKEETETSESHPTSCSARQTYP